MSDERVNSNSADSNDEVLQWVTYRLGEETYGINVMQVQEGPYVSLLELVKTQNPKPHRNHCTLYTISGIGLK